MTKTELKTKQTSASVAKFLKSIPDKQKREDSYKLIDIMKKITKAKPKMWGPSIIGFGKYHYKYASGHEGDMCAAGFSPRKQALTIYIAPGLKKVQEFLKKLGTHKTSVSCLYVKKLADIDIKVLKEIINESVKYIKNKKW
jgi:hypothetical protein